MWALLTLVPVGLVVGLLLFGDYGHRSPQATARKLATAAGAAVLLGPVAVSILGLLNWLVAIVVVAAGMTALAMLRPPLA